MPPASSSEALVILASLGSVLPFLAPAKAIIQLIAQSIENVKNNRNQCIYLLRRSTNICERINRLYGDRKREDVTSFLTALDKIKLFIEHISTKSTLKCFLQRQEISERIQDCHRSLENTLELFNLSTTASLIFVTAEHEAARERDNESLAGALAQLQKGDENILEALELQGDQIMEAIRGLRDTLGRGIDDAVQKQFATESLQTLLQRQAGTHTNQPTSYDWAISSLEILIEGEVLGSGAFGVVYTGRWQGTRVAVKQLMRGTPRQLLINEIDIWRSIQHPHVASFFRASVDSHPALLVSELYQFGNATVYLSMFPHANRVKMR